MENEIKTLGEILADLPRNEFVGILAESETSPTGYRLIAHGDAQNLYATLGIFLLRLKAELDADGYIIVSDERIRPIAQ